MLSWFCPICTHNLDLGYGNTGCGVFKLGGGGEGGGGGGGGGTERQAVGSVESLTV